MNFFTKHRKVILLAVIAAVNLILWAIPSNLDKLIQKCHPIYLYRYSLEKASFLIFIMIPLSALLIYLVLSPNKKELKKRVFAVITILLVMIPGIIITDIALRIIHGARYIQTEGVYHRPPNKHYSVTFQDKPKNEELFGNRYKSYPTSQCSMTIDKWGFRNTNTDKTNFDIVLIGDSFTEGSHVSDDAVWGRILEKKTGKSVYNLGMSGTDPLAYWLTFEKFGLKLSPKIVICTIYEGNDFRGEISPGRIRAISIKVAKDGSTVLVKRPETLHTKLRIIKKTSPVINSIRKFMEKYLITDSRKDKVSKSNPSAKETTNDFPLWSPLTVTTDNGDIQYYLLDDKRLHQLSESKKDFKDSLGWKGAKAALKRLKETCDEQKAKLIVCYAPSKAHVVLPLIDKKTISPEKLYKYVFMETGSADECEQFLDKIYNNLEVQEETLRTFCADDSITFISFTKPLRAAITKNNAQVYYTFDQHWSPDGHKVAANVLIEYLEKTKKTHR